MARKESSATCRNGLIVMACSARATELLPTLPAPLRTMMVGRGCNGSIAAHCASFRQTNSVTIQALLGA